MKKLKDCPARQNSWLQQMFYLSGRTMQHRCFCTDQLWSTMLSNFILYWAMLQCIDELLMVGKQKIATSMLINSYHPIDLFWTYLKTHSAFLNWSCVSRCNCEPDIVKSVDDVPNCVSISEHTIRVLHRLSASIFEDQEAISGEKVEKVKVRKGESERVRK